MLIRTGVDGFQHPHSSDITPREAYFSRRLWLAATAASGLAWAGREAFAQGTARPNRLAALPGQRSPVDGALTTEKLTSYQDVTQYNNFYEFGTGKADPAARADSLQPRPWTVQVEG